MARVTAFTAERSLEIENTSIVGGHIDVSGHLILEQRDGTEIDAGSALPALPVASATVQGIVELATAAETLARSDAMRAVTPASLTSTISAVNADISASNSAISALDARVDVLEVPVDPITVGFTGEIRMFAGAAAPAGWRLCDGSTLNRTGTGAALFTLIGTTYGAGNGTTTYNLPNLKGRAPVGLDTGQGEFNALGVSGGAKTHTLSSGEMPSHTHTQQPHTHLMQGTGALTDGSSGTSYIVPNGSYYGFRTDQPNDTTAVNNATGGGGAHNNLAPYLTVNFIIKL